MGAGHEYCLFEALDKYQEREKAIVSWQKGIVDRKDWPEWFKQPFNELMF